MTERDTPVMALREAVDALPWLDVTLEDGETGGQMVAKHAVLDLIDAALASSDDVAGSGERPDFDAAMRVVGVLVSEGLVAPDIETYCREDAIAYRLGWAAAPTTQAPREETPETGEEAP
jgi:hypothetical protein